MKSFTSIVLASLALCTGPAGAKAQDAPSSDGIILEIGGLSSYGGTIYCRLFDQAEGFPGDGDKAIAEVRASLKDSVAECRFADVAAGTYAISVWHDIDDNGTLDTNFLGIPKEPVGASNNATGRFGPPKFEKAAFSYEPPQYRQSIQLQ